MEAKELRIGNYVRAKSPENKTYEEPVMVNISYLEMFCRKIQGVNFEPIPLTEDWLIDFGFMLFKESPFYESVLFYDDFIVFLDEKKWFHGLKKGDIEIKYVHQLQNLYFALTGQELTLKN